MTVDGGSGTNTFILDGTDTWDGNDNITGGAGTDTISITGGGTTDLSSLGTYSAIEAVVMDNNATIVTLADAATTATGGTAGDTITLGNANMSVNGGDGADTIIIASGDTWDANDSVAGGDGTDTVSVTGSGTVDFTTGGSTFTTIENVDLTGATSGVDVTLGNDALTVTAGDLNTTLQTGSNTDTITLGDGNMAISSGLGNDTITADADDTWDGSDSIDGEGGTGDLLKITGSGTGAIDLATASVANVENVEIVDGSTIGAITLDGDGYAITLGTATITSLTVGAGTDTLTIGDDNLDGETIDLGDTGTDTLVITDAGSDDTISNTAADMAAIDGVEVISYTGVGDAITLEVSEDMVDGQDGAGADNTGDITVSFGANTLSLDADAVTASTESVTLTGTGAVTLSSAATRVAVGSSIVNITTTAASNTINAADGTLTTDTITATAAGGDTLRFSDALDDSTNEDFNGTITNVTGFEGMTFGVTGNSDTVILADGLIQGTTFTVTTDAGAAGTETYTLDTSNVSDSINVAIAGGVATLSANDDRVLVSDAAASIDGAAGDDRFIYTDVDNLDTNDSITGGAHTNGDAIIITTDTSTDLNIANGNDLSNVATVDFLAIVGDTTTGSDVTGTHAVDATSEIGFSVIDGSVTLTGTATASDHTVLATGTVTLTSGDAYTMADVSGTVAHSAAFAEVASVLTAYTGGTATLGAAGTVVGGSGTDSFDITGGTAATIDVDGAAGVDTITTDNNSWTDDTVVDGGTGEDVVVFTDAITTALSTTASTDGNKENIEEIQLGANGNTVVLGAGIADKITDSGTGDLLIDTDGYTITSFQAADGAVTVTGGNNTGTNNVTITMSTGASDFTVFGASTITLHTGADHDITGGSSGNAGVDTWSIAETDLDGSDTLDGADGSDVLIVTESGGNGTGVVDADWANITNIETVKVGTVTGGQTSSFVFGSNADTFIGNGNTVTLDLNGQEAAGFTVDTSGLASTRTLELADSSDATVTVTLATGGNAVSIASGDAASITGGTGDDTVTGNDGNDTVSAGDGNDVIYTGAGTDSITGGNGNDDIIVNDLSETKITDFKTNGADEIKFSDAVFDFNDAFAGVAFGANDIKAVGVDFTGGNSTQTSNFLYDTTDGQIWYDADASGAGSTAVLVATVENFAAYSFSATDFAAVA